MSFEKDLARLEQIAAALDRADLSLDESLALFEEGIKRLRDASDALAKAEGRVTTLVEQANGALEERDVGN
ncbi:MAG: exodeoxyribonuclease VII small subunit [Gemmatimonadetes bacterium]|nr:exodeoxyribonuclease VII small subunit [Gemmatimonadota bacterium]